MLANFVQGVLSTKGLIKPLSSNMEKHLNGEVYTNLAVMLSCLVLLSMTIAQVFLHKIKHPLFMHRSESHKSSLLRQCHQQQTARRLQDHDMYVHYIYPGYFGLGRRIGYCCGAEKGHCLALPIQMAPYRCLHVIPPPTKNCQDPRLICACSENDEPTKEIQQDLN